MNQILSTDNNSNKNTLGYTKKIIVVFCIILIIFGIAIAAVAGYNFYKKKNENTQIDNLNKPEIQLEQLDNGIKVVAKYDEGINKITYLWDKQDKKEINLEGKSNIEKLIEFPERNGEHSLIVQAEGADNTINEIEQTFKIGEVTTDGEGPTIEWTKETKIFLKVSSEVGMDYITYKWGETEETRIEANTENPLLIETTIEAPRGKNTLTIVAVDINGKETTKKGIFNGVKEPEIEIAQYGNILKIILKHDMGFKKIEFTLNNMKYIYDENYSEYNKDQTEVEFDMEIAGETIVKVKAESNEETVKEFKGKCGI